MCPGHCPLMREQPLFFGLNYTSKAALSAPDVDTRYPRLADDIAQFLLVRGEYAWLGLGFVSCHPATNYTLPSGHFERDYGTPTAACVAAGDGVFRRGYSKVSVEVDCRKGTTAIHPLQ